MHYIKDCLTYVGSIFPMVNPFSTVPLFLALTVRMTLEERKKLGDTACRNATIIMLVGLFLGTLLLHFFNISVPSLRIAGGLVVSFLGFSMLFPTSNPDGINPISASQSGVNYAVIPLAFPSMAGAGSLATIMTISAINASKDTWAERIYSYTVSSLAIIIVGLLCFLVLRTSNRLKKFLGPEGLDAMTRIMGLIMVCIGVQFIATGVGEFMIAHEKKYSLQSDKEATNEAPVAVEIPPLVLDENVTTPAAVVEASEPPVSANRVSSDEE
ncbi:MAG: MarC family NAAT transporter [Verrucomicrobiota bacterium]|jgi:multiple antibiotic resistance protein|nr:MarC family NAAT transporter [Verrucomicrobiota bacterium]